MKEVEPVVRLDFRERDDCGVLHAICPPCGDTLKPNSTVIGTLSALRAATNPTVHWPTISGPDGQNSTRAQAP